MPAIIAPNNNDKPADDKQAKQAAKKRARDRMYAKLTRFDALPNAAVVDDYVAAAILNMSMWTLRRENPVPQRRLSARRIGRSVGDLRKLIQESGA